MAVAETVKAKNTFDELRGKLGDVKNELSPYGWIEYNANYSEQQAVAKKMKNEMTYSDNRPDAQENTPLWQERFDQIMLTEHLKKKMMQAQKSFSEASALMMKCHHFLSKNTYLADSFAHAITHIPESTHDQVELLQVNLGKTKEELKETKEAFYLFQRSTQQKWNTMLDKLSARYTAWHADQDLADAFEAFGYGCQREAALGLRAECANLKARVADLEDSLAKTTKEFADSREQWAKEKADLEADRDRYKAMHEKQMKAAEQALRDLKKSAAANEDKDKQLQRLTQERINLAAKIEDLEYQLKVTTKKLEDTEEKLQQTEAALEKTTEELRQNTIRMNVSVAEETRLGAAVDALEKAIIDGRVELAAVRQAAKDRENELLEEIERIKEEEERQKEELRQELAKEIKQKEDTQEALASSEAERKDLVAQLEWTIQDCERRIEETIQYWTKKLEDTVAKMNADFARETAALKKQNSILQHEVGKADALLPHLSTLNPLPQPDKGSSRCLHCKRYVTFQGVWK